MKSFKFLITLLFLLVISQFAFAAKFDLTIVNDSKRTINFYISECADDSHFNNRDCYRDKFIQEFEQGDKLPLNDLEPSRTEAFYVWEMQSGASCKTPVLSRDQDQSIKRTFTFTAEDKIHRITCISQ